MCSAMLIYGANVTKINQPRTNAADADERRKYKLSRIILETLNARTDAGLTNLKHANHKIEWAAVVVQLSSPCLRAASIPPI